MYIALVIIDLDASRICMVQTECYRVLNSLWVYVHIYTVASPECMQLLTAVLYSNVNLREIYSARLRSSD